jgi:FkbM family methyltransferase
MTACLLFPLAAKALKLVRVLAVPAYARAFLKTRTAAAVEHEALLHQLAPATVIDVGANKGQFALAARRALPQAILHAFEVLPGPLAILRRNLSGDAHFTAHALALSDAAGEAKFHVASREDSSSLLGVGAAQEAVFDVREARAIRVKTARLDDLGLVETCPGPILLKLDVQGAELQVLRGAEGVLDRIALIYVECSYVELYEGQALFPEVRAWLEARGFRFEAAYNTHSDPKLGPVQADMLFRKIER